MVLLPLLFLVYHRRWRSLASFAAIALPLVVVSLIVAGPQAIIDYPRLVLDTTAWQTNGIDARQMFGWNGILADLTSDLSPSRFVLVALALPTLALVAWRWRGDWTSQLARLPGVMALTLAGSLLVNPHLYFYDMTLREPRARPRRRPKPALDRVAGRLARTRGRLLAHAAAPPRRLLRRGLPPALARDRGSLRHPLGLAQDAQPRGGSFRARSILAPTSRLTRLHVCPSPTASQTLSS